MGGDEAPPAYVRHNQVPATMSASAANSGRCDTPGRTRARRAGRITFHLDSVAEGRSRDDEEVRARHVGFFDGNASNFLIAYVRDRPYIRDVKSIPAMIVKGRTTRQGLRDLNYYGPRRVKDAAGAAGAAAPVADAETRPGSGTAGGPSRRGA